MTMTRAFLMLGILISPMVATGEDRGKVLMILSNGATVGEFAAKNNFWEYAEPHHVFVMHGFVVTSSPPKGGTIVLPGC